MTKYSFTTAGACVNDCVRLVRVRVCVCVVFSLDRCYHACIRAATTTNTCLSGAIGDGDACILHHFLDVLACVCSGSTKLTNINERACA